MRIYNQKNKNIKKNIPYLIIILLIMSGIGYGFLRSIENPAINYFQYLMTIIPIYLFYAIMVLIILKFSKRISLPVYLIFIFGFIFRIVTITQEPSLSDDIYRYIWDGRVSADCVNPYQYPPNHPELEHLQDSQIYIHINYPEIATVYPPASQLFFLANTFFGDSVFSWKIILLVLEAILTIILLKLANLFHLSRYRIVIFSLNPLIIIETYQSGHLELLGLLFFWWAVYFYYKKADGFSVLLFIFSVLIKFLPGLIFIPFLLNKFWKKMPLILAGLLISILPFTLNGTIPMAGFLSYINRWSFNGFIFKVSTELFNVLNFPVFEIGDYDLNWHLEVFYINQEFYYKIIAVIILLFVLIDQVRRQKMCGRLSGIMPIQSGFFITATILLLMPTLHPWYLIWIIPFLVFTPNWAWLSFTFLIQLSYQVLAVYRLTGIWEESGWILAIEYIPFYIILILEYMDKKR